MICHILLDLSIYGRIPKFLFRTPYVLYGKRVVDIEKLTGGGKSTCSGYTVPGSTSLLVSRGNTVDYIYIIPNLRARGGSTAAARRPFSERGVQLSTTDNFCRKNGKCCTIKYCISFLRILGFSDVVLNSTTFSIFSAKIISST